MLVGVLERERQGARRKAAMIDVADDFGVSVSTVKRALRAKEPAWFNEAVAACTPRREGGPGPINRD
jgi:hypothetical protein